MRRHKSQVLPEIAAVAHGNLYQTAGGRSRPGRCRALFSAGPDGKGPCRAGSRCPARDIGIGPENLPAEALPRQALQRPVRLLIIHMKRVIPDEKGDKTGDGLPKSHGFSLPLQPGFQGHNTDIFFLIQRALKGEAQGPFPCRADAEFQLFRMAHPLCTPLSAASKNPFSSTGPNQ